jgi:PAS domain S-box-containing protein
LTYQSEQAMTTAILRDMADGVMVIDEKNIIQYLNPAATSILELDRKLEGVKYGEFFASDGENDGFHEFVLDAVYDKDKTHSGTVAYKTEKAVKTLKVTTSFIFDEERTRKIGISVVFSDITESERLTQLRNTFSKYVDPKLVDSLIIDGTAVSDKVGGERPIAVLFADVRGFTPMAESMRNTPEAVVKILNEYLELATDTVFQNGGSVDKFIGDATMALFNGFTPLEDYVYLAVKTAWSIARGADALNIAIKEKYQIDLGVGVGVHFGGAIVGNLGPSFRKDYTAIGDVVNTAARLEASAKPGQVLVSRQTYEAVKERVQAESMGEIQLKGKSLKLEVFSISNVF